MGDLSSEPSMEEILSSIKRIIAEEGDTSPARRLRPGRAAAARHTDDEDEVLELSDRVPDEAPVPRAASAVPPPAETVAQPTVRPAPTPEPAAAPIVSTAAAQATRGSLDNLSRLLVKAEPPSDGTLEGLVRELLRPMLREWIDANLPGMVEQMVAKEIKRITEQG